MKLSLWQAYAGAFDTCWRERAAGVRFGAIPLAVALALSILLQASGFDQTAKDGSARHVQLALALAGIVQGIVYLPMAVSWYRMIVLGHDAAGRRPAFTLGRLEARMLGWQAVIVAVAALAIGVVFGIAAVIYVGVSLTGNGTAAAVAAGIAGAPLLLAILISVNRLALALVLVAADQPVSLTAAWALTRGIATPLFVVVVMILLTGAAAVYAFRLVALLVGMIAAMAFNATATAVVPYLVLVGQDVAGLIVFLAVATLFGTVYRMIERLPKAAPA